MLTRISNGLRSRYKQYCHEKVEEVVFKKSLHGEAYNVKNSKIGIIEGDRQLIEDFLHGNPPLQKYRAIADSYFDNNIRAAVALMDGEPIGYVWWTDAQKDSPECQHPHVHRYGLDLDDGDVWGFDLHILPQYRGDGTAADFFQLYRKQLLELGYSVLWGSAEKDNLPAMWLHRMHRYDEVKTVRSTRWFGRWLHVNIDGGRWYVKNSASSRQKFDYRCISNP